MIVFVFGAGASKGSQREKVTAPHLVSPLVNNLFDEAYYEKYKLQNFTPEEIQTMRDIIENTSLEQYLTERWENVSDIKTSMGKKAEEGFFGYLVLYLWEIFRGVSATYNSKNSYTTLLRHLKGKEAEFGVITFNYDLLIERAFSDVFVSTFADIEDYETWRLAKPHGSINWFLGRRDIDRASPAESSIDYEFRKKLVASQMYGKEPLDFNSIHTIDPEHKDLYSLTSVFAKYPHKYCYPLLFAPLSGKTYKVVKGFEDRVINLGKRLMEEASEVILVGYSARDEIINELLERCKPKTRLHVVDPMDPAEILNRVMSENGHLQQGDSHRKGFEQFSEDFGMYPLRA